MPTLNSVVTNYVIPSLPSRWRLPFQYRWHCRDAGAEQELIHLEKIPARFHAAVDVGANVGLYTYKMARHFREVYAFEANADLTRDLRHYGARNVRVFDQGLSSREGQATLYTPVLKNGYAMTGWSSLSREELLKEFPAGNTDVHIEEKPVPIGRLDTHGLRDVDLIKIDVEGHEAEVLRGAVETLRTSRPRLLIEVKEDLAQMDAFLQELDYWRMPFEDLARQRASPNLYLYVVRNEAPASGIPRAGA